MASAYAAALLLHSWLRWGVLGSTALCALGAARGWRRRRAFTAADARRVRWCVALVDLQLLLGLVLYAALSPITTVARRDVGAAMGNDVLRFFLVEHPFSMLLGVVLVHAGLARGRRHAAAPERHRTTLRATAAALLCFLVGMPWPGLPYARPLARFPAWRVSQPARDTR